MGMYINIEDAVRQCEHLAKQQQYIPHVGLWSSQSWAFDWVELAQIQPESSWLPP